MLNFIKKLNILFLPFPPNKLSQGTSYREKNRCESATASEAKRTREQPTRKYDRRRWYRRISGRDRATVTSSDVAAQMRNKRREKEKDTKKKRRAKESLTASLVIGC